jgi:ABC-type molybdenum transport system ATPase subunit/photorepair protein PhrA
MPSIIADRRSKRNLLDPQTATVSTTRPKKDLRQSELLISIRKADVFLDRKKVLRGIDWEMRADQNWAIFGANGAGKSTFAKLVFGDLHPAAGAQLRRFDLTARDSIWDIKNKIGYVSPDFQAGYRDRLTGGQAIASGFFASVGLISRPARRQKQRVRELVRRFDCLALAEKEISRMSYGEFRKILLLRSLVHRPRILICDEPFDGLDSRSRAEFRRALEHVSENGTRLIVVTHHLDDLPACITHGLRMHQGRIQWQGELSAARRRGALEPAN